MLVYSHEEIPTELLDLQPIAVVINVASLILRIWVEVKKFKATAIYLLC